jgi:hypothetical protein
MMALRSYLGTVMSVASTIVVISFVTPFFTVCLVPILIYYAIQQSFFTVSKMNHRGFQTMFESSPDPKWRLALLSL